MKSRLLFLLRSFMFWVLFFMTGRILFLLFHLDKTAELSFPDVFFVLLNGLRMDLSMAGYMLLIPTLLILISSFFSFVAGYRVLHIYTTFFLILFGILIASDLELYNHWNFRMDASPLLYLGKDMPMTLSIMRFFGLLGIAIFLIIVSFSVYYFWIVQKYRSLSPLSWKWAWVFLFILLALILPIRGGVGIAPLNTGMVYFHPTSSFANHSAVNVLWNIGYSLGKINAQLPENIMPEDETIPRMATFSRREGTGSKLISTARPNILLIILESYSSKLIGRIHQGKPVSPMMDSLTRQSIQFPNFFASGTRTDKGVVAIMNGYPTQPTASIIKFPKKTQSLPYINKVLQAAGYTTSFSYGGDINFANFRSYLSSAAFDEITTSDDFPEHLNTSKWGVHDEFVLDKVLEECDASRQPFFKTVLTLSSHEPFEVPMEPVFQGKDEESLFLNSAHYTDKVLGEFLKEAKSRDWWENTWVIITADHGHRLPDDDPLTDPERYRIPFLWLGGAVVKGDTTISTFGSQTDIANTLLSQLDLAENSFQFSRDLLRTNISSPAIYIFNNGFGVVGENADLVFDFETRRWLRQEGDTLQGDIGRAFMQTLHQDFNSR